MSEVVYQTMAAPPALQGHVRYFWALEDGNTQEERKTFRTMADGCPGLIFQHADAGAFFQQHKRLPEIFLFGQTTRYAEIELAGNFNTVGVYLYPNALQTIFGYGPVELTNSCLDLNLFAKKQGFRLSEELSDARSSGDKINILSNYLFTQVNRNQKQANPSMQYALQQILASKGTLSLKNLQQNLKMPERSFHRNFKQHTGISPKLFSRICRFQASLKQLNEVNYDKLSDIAYCHDYADQSHFIRSFKEFSGMSPIQYQKQATAVMENLSEIRG